VLNMQTNSKLLKNFNFKKLERPELVGALFFSIGFVL